MCEENLLHIVLSSNVYRLLVVEHDSTKLTSVEPLIKNIGVKSLQGLWDRHDISKLGSRTDTTYMRKVMNKFASRKKKLKAPKSARAFLSATVETTKAILRRIKP